nr:SDR family oxidoreductase [Prochlorococcus marinus]
MNTKRFDLKGKTALITGAAGLLGQQHAMALLECDCDVVLTDINKDALIKTKNNLLKYSYNSKFSSYYMDITSEESIIEVNKEIKKKGSKIDILINNAALDPKVVNNDNRELTRLENFSIEQWNLELSVGLTGAFLCSKVFGNEMSKNEGGGIIINIASDLAVISPDQRLYQKEDLSENNQPVKPVTYSVIKFGLIGLTKYLATYWIGKNIRCNALSPGGVYQDHNDLFFNKIKKLIPLERMANKDEYRSAIQFLCSDASSYMNGHNLIMDGGRSVW